MRATAFWLTLILLLVVTNLTTFFVMRQESSQEKAEVAGDENTMFREIEEQELEKADLIFEVMDILKNEYVEPVHTSDLIEGAVKGMMDSLDDPQSAYLDPEYLEELMMETEGYFSGIGVRVTEVENRVVVLEVLPDTPSEEVGLERGDRIRKVDGEELEDHTLEEAVDRMRGEEGTEVQVTVDRPGSTDPLSFDIKRGQIRTQTVEHDWLEEGIGYMEIGNFDRRTGEEVKDVLQKMEDEGLQGLVLDLRYNPGGLLDQALEVADIFLPQGVITSLVGRDDEVISTYQAQGESRPYPLAVLINEESASGSEIVAGALQDHGEAVLVGESTFGKATVQEIDENLTEGGLRYTIARYVTPDGRDLHEEGLLPDYKVEASRVFSYYRYLIPETLERGDQGESVLLLQEMLEVIGHEVDLTREFDEQTAEALRAFQREQGLASEGVFNEITWLYLREEVDKRVMDDDPQINKALEIIKTR